MNYKNEKKKYAYMPGIAFIKFQKQFLITFYYYY